MKDDDSLWALLSVSRQEPAEEATEGVWDRSQAALDAQSFPPLPGLIGRASRAASSVLDDRLQVVGMTGTQIEVLTRNLALGYSGVSELADELGMASATVSGVLRRLESKGLVRRQVSEVDPRVRGSRVTRRGAEKVAWARDHVAAVTRIALSGLSRTDAAELDQLLRLAIGNLRAERRNKGLRPR